MPVSADRDLRLFAVTWDQTNLYFYVRRTDAGKNSVRGEEKIRSWQVHLDEKIAVLEQEWAENEKREASLFGESNPWTNGPGKDVKKAIAAGRKYRATISRRLKLQEKEAEEKAEVSET